MQWLCVHVQMRFIELILRHFHQASMRHPQGQDHIDTTIHWVTGVMKSNSLFVSDRITSYALSYVTKYLIPLTQSTSLVIVSMFTHN